MPSKLYQRIKRERVVTYGLWVVMIALLAWGVISWVNHLQEQALTAERDAQRMADLIAETEKTQQHLAELVASFQAQEQRTQEERARFRQDVNAILERLGIEVSEEAVDAESSSGGGEPEGTRTSSITLRDTAAGRVLRRTLRIPAETFGAPPPESVPRPEQPTAAPQPKPKPPTAAKPKPAPAPAPQPRPAPDPRPRPEPQPPPAQAQPREPQRAPQASERGERGPPAHAEAHGRDKPKTPPGGARGRSGPPPDRGPPDHAQGKGPKR